MARAEILGRNRSLLDRVEIVGREEILGSTFVGQDELLAAREGSRSERTALARRLLPTVQHQSTSGYNGHLAYIKGSGKSYQQLVDEAKRAKKISPAQLETVAQALFAELGPSATGRQDSLRLVLRENFKQAGVAIS